MSYTLSADYTLPSKGKIYTTEVNPNIKLRSMTTIEEMRRLSKSDRQYQNMAEIIDDCLVEPIGISAYDLALGDYQFLLHKLRVVTYGEDYEIGSTCPTCGHLNTGVVNLDSLIVNEYNENVDKLLTVTLPRCGKTVQLQFQTPRMIDDIALEAKEQRRRKKLSTNITYTLTLKSAIVTVDGRKLDPIKLEDFVNNLEMMDANILMQTIVEINNSIGLDTKLEIECENCGLTYNNSFRITSEFFGPRVYK